MRSAFFAFFRMFPYNFRIIFNLAQIDRIFFSMEEKNDVSSLCCFKSCFRHTKKNAMFDSDFFPPRDWKREKFKDHNFRFYSSPPLRFFLLLFLSLSKRYTMTVFIVRSELFAAYFPIISFESQKN